MRGGVRPGRRLTKDVAMGRNGSAEWKDRGRCRKRRGLPALTLGAIAVLTLLSAEPAAGQRFEPRFSIEAVLSPAFPLDLVAARGADRVAWISYDEGVRNVHTAAGPVYRPSTLTSNARDDGIDVSGLQISDDGEVVAWIRGHAPNREGWVANPASDPRGQERAVWAASTRGGDPWRVVEANAFTLSPDGRWVAYVRDGQIHRAEVNAGLAQPTDAAPLFVAFGNNRAPVWSPDDARIAFESDRGTHSFVGIYDTRAPSLTWIDPAVDYDSSPTWSPDGRRVAFIRRPGRPFGEGMRRPEAIPDSAFPPGLVDARFADGSRLSIRVVDLESGEARELWRSPPDDDRFAQVRSIRWVGEHIVFEAEPDEWRHWFSLPADGAAAAPIELTPGEGFVEHVAFSADGRWLYFAANIGDIDRRHLWRVRTNGGTPERLTSGETIATFPTVPGRGERVVFLHADERTPLTPAVLGAGGGEARLLVDVPPEFPTDRHVSPTNVVLMSPDSVVFHSQLFLPPDLRPGERRPALIFIHGGPRRQMLLGYHPMHFYHMAYGINQYFANRGYVVLSVNYRGGIGYGRSFRMAENVGRNGSAEYQDILTAGLYLRARPDVDSTKIGLWGLSYGGILTAQGLARNSDVFAAGVDIAGVHFWGDSIDPDAPMYRASSISEIANWRSPVLLIHGDDDRNVAFSQTVGLVQLLRGHGVPYELIVFPDEVHDFLIHERWLIAFNATDRFFERTLIRGETVRANGDGR